MHWFAHSNSEQKGLMSRHLPAVGGRRSATSQGSSHSCHSAGTAQQLYWTLPGQRRFVMACANSMRAADVQETPFMIPKMRQAWHITQQVCDMTAAAAYWYLISNIHA
jgi:hypothetical protein